MRSPRTRTPRLCPLAPDSRGDRAGPGPGRARHRRMRAGGRPARLPRPGVHALAGAAGCGAGSAPTPTTPRSCPAPPYYAAQSGRPGGLRAPWSHGARASSAACGSSSLPAGRTGVAGPRAARGHTARSARTGDRHHRAAPSLAGAAGVRRRPLEPRAAWHRRPDATDVPQEIAGAQPGLRMRAAEKLRRVAPPARNAPRRPTAR